MLTYIYCYPAGDGWDGSGECKKRDDVITEEVED